MINKDANMSNWLVRLAGRAVDLKSLAGLLSCADTAVFEKGGSYYLRSKAVETLKTSEEVQATADQILETVYSLAKLRFGDFQPINANAIVKMDKHGKPKKSVVHGQVVITASSSLRVNAILVKEDEILEQPVQPSEFASWVQLAGEDSNVRDALRFFVATQDGTNLGKVLEVIQRDIGGQKKIWENGWASKKDVKCFSHSIQSQDVLGDQARHARFAQEPPKTPMPLYDCYTFIKHILEQWLRSKI